MEPPALASSSSFGLCRLPPFSPLSSGLSHHFKQHRCQGILFFPSLDASPAAKGRGCSFVTFVPKAVAEVLDGRPSRSGAAGGGGAGGRGGRRVLRQSQAQATAPSFPVKEVASFVVPAGALVAATFGMWFASPS